MSFSSESLYQLGQQLSDPDHQTRISTLSELIRRGRAAVPVLCQAFSNPDTEVRVLAAEGLAEMAEPGLATLYLQMLKDDDDRIRARGAQGLYGIHHPNALDALVATIDDLQDFEHFPQTLSIHILIAYGAAALPKVAPLLSAKETWTRERAFYVILQILEILRGSSEITAQIQNLGDPRKAGKEGEKAASDWQSWIAQEYQ